MPKESAMSRPGHGFIAYLTLVGCGLLGGCFAHVGYEDDYYEAPPPAYVTTVEPYYYDGRPVYWWRGGWHYHDHGHWRRYRVEPEPLRSARIQGPRAVGPTHAAPVTSPGPRFSNPNERPGSPPGARFGNPGAHPAPPGPRFDHPSALPSRPAPAPQQHGGPRSGPRR